jgi:UrcA family protein
MTTSFNRTARSSWLVAGAAATIAMFACDAQADTSQITVHFDKSTDVRQLYSKLQSAAAAVCREHEGRELRNVSETRACYNEALGNAVSRIDNAPLTSLHRASGDIRLAEHDMNRQHRS